MATQTGLSKDEILDAIGNMSVFELAELIEAFKTKFGVTIAAPVAAAPAGGAAAAAAPAVEEQSEFTVMLKSGGDKKIQVIKEVRDHHQPGPQGGEGPGGGRRHGEGRRVQTGSRRDQEEARSAGRRRRTEVGRVTARHSGGRCTPGLLWF